LNETPRLIETLTMVRAWVAVTNHNLCDGDGIGTAGPW
jgi:hypothetical protein